MNDYKNQIGLIGTDDSGVCLLRNLTRNCFSVNVYDSTKKNYESLRSEGFTCFDSVEAMLNNFYGQIIIMLNGNWNNKTEYTFNSLLDLLPERSIIIDATNSGQEIILTNLRKCKKRNLGYIDVSFIGTLDDLTWGPSLLVGGDVQLFNYLEPIFNQINSDKKVFYFDSIGSSHYLKNIHDGIENSFVQSVIEGLALVQKSPHNFDTKKTLTFFKDASLLKGRVLDLISKSFLIDSKENTNNINGHQLLAEHSVYLNIVVKDLITVTQKTPTLSTACFSSLNLISTFDTFSKTVFCNYLKMKKFVDED